MDNPRLTQLAEVLRLTEVLIAGIQGEDLTELSEVESRRATLLQSCMSEPVVSDEKAQVMALLNEIAEKDATLSTLCQQVRADLKSKLADLDRGKSALKAYGNIAK